MEPLASKIRPKNLDEFIGQEHLVGPNKPIRDCYRKKHLFSFILWGTPGVGKTTLAKIYANALDAKFYELSAVSAGKDDIKKIIKDESTSSADSSQKDLKFFFSTRFIVLTKPSKIFYCPMWKLAN